MGWGSLTADWGMQGSAGVRWSWQYKGQEKKEVEYEWNLGRGQDIQNSEVSSGSQNALLHTVLTGTRIPQCLLLFF